jgi:hypothetical protein
MTKLVGRQPANVTTRQTYPYVVPTQNLQTDRQTDIDTDRQTEKKQKYTQRAYLLFVRFSLRLATHFAGSQ